MDLLGSYGAARCQALAAPADEWAWWQAGAAQPSRHCVHDRLAHISPARGTWARKKAVSWFFVTPQQAAAAILASVVRTRFGVWRSPLP